MNEITKIIKQLQQFGMSEKEAIVYVTLSQLGPSSIQEISKHSNINRSTTHVLCEKLKQEGLVEETRKGKKRILFVEDTNKFRQIVEQEQAHLRLKEMALGGLIPALQTLHPTQKDSPKVRFYEGEQGFMDVCQRSLDKAKKHILFISSMDDFYDVTTSAYDQDYYIPERIKKGIKIYILAFENSHTLDFKKKDKENLRETRFLPIQYKFKSTMFIYGNEFSMITSKVPFLGVVIESKELTDFMRQLFYTLWDSAI